MDTLEFEAMLSEMDESSLSNPPSSDSDSSDSSGSDGKAGPRQNGEGPEHEEEEVDDDDDEDDDDEGQDQTSEQQTDWLATTRERRSTAGNRMKSMLANEEPDSDFELLFAEDDNDAGFSDAEDHASDEQMDSSDDDDDDENADDTNAGDDLAGEKELERQAREKRAAQRKRKAQSAIPAKFRKRVRIDATVSETSSPAPRRPAPASAFAPRPRKKSERLSWLPSPADMPTRASSRETTRLSKKQLHQQMVEREEKRQQQMVRMQKKAARLEALKKPPMTQEDRLREAAIVEERNSKSLNRWEVAEKRREEERRAKLAALHQRTLSGPVITLWSGIGEARRAVVEEEKPPMKKRERTDKLKNKATTDAKTTGTGKEAHGDGVAGADAQKYIDSTTPLKPSQQPRSISPLSDPAPSTAAASEGKTLKLPVRQDIAETRQTDKSESTTSGPADEDSRPRLMAMPPRPSPPPIHRTGYVHPPGSSGKPSRVLAAPVLAAPILAPPPSMNVDFDPNQVPKSNVLAPPNTSPLVSRPALPRAHMQSHEGISKHPPTTTARFLHPSEIDEMQGVKNEEVPVESSTADDVHHSEPTSQQATETSADLATTTRNAIIFQNFDKNAIKDKSILTQILFGRGMDKLSKPPPASICAITNLPARYRDPKTGLAYHNAYAYREIQRLSRGEHRWSKILNAWVGSGKVAARGVPERFLNPDAPRSTTTAAAVGEEKEKEKEGEEGKKKQTSKSTAQGPAEPKKTAGGQEQQAEKNDSSKRSTKLHASGGAPATPVTKPVPAK